MSYRRGRSDKWLGLKAHAFKAVLKHRFANVYPGHRCFLKHGQTYSANAYNIILRLDNRAHVITGLSSLIIIAKAYITYLGSAESKGRARVAFHLQTIRQYFREYSAVRTLIRRRRVILAWTATQCKPFGDKHSPFGEKYSAQNTPIHKYSIVSVSGNGKQVRWRSPVNELCSLLHVDTS